MREHWMGDVGDYGKFGLLLELHKVGFKSLGIVWYLVRGGTFRYLTDLKGKRFKNCNPELYSKLDLLVSQRQMISEIMARQILPKETVSFDRPVPSTKSARQTWLNEALARVRECDLIFLDPDNGLVPSKSAKRLQRYVTDEELKEFLKVGKALVLYQHLAPTSHEEQVDKLLQRVKAHHDGCNIQIIGYAGRLFVVVAPCQESLQVASGVSRFISKYECVGAKLLINYETPLGSSVSA